MIIFMKVFFCGYCFSPMTYVVDKSLVVAKNIIARIRPLAVSTKMLRQVSKI